MSSKKDQEPILLGSSPTPVLLRTLSGAGHRNPLSRDQQQGKHHLVKQEVRRQGSGHSSVRGSRRPGSFSSSCPSPLECWLPPGADYPHVLTGWLRHFQGTLRSWLLHRKKKGAFPSCCLLLWVKKSFLKAPHHHPTKLSLGSSWTNLCHPALTFKPVMGSPWLSQTHQELGVVKVPILPKQVAIWEGGILNKLKVLLGSRKREVMAVG